MNFIEVKIITTTYGTEIITEKLSDITTGFVIDDPVDLKNLMEAPIKRWDYIDARLINVKKDNVTVSFYLENNEDGKFQLDEVMSRILLLKNSDEDNLLGKLEVNHTEVKSEDWENNWKQYYKPFLIGSRLLVRPSWEEVTPKDGEKVMTIDPASSFGTGSHATTRLCLEELETMNLSGKSMFDAGCGSGILATAGMILGCENIVACDIEDNAVFATKENLKINGISEDKILVLKGDFLQDTKLKEKIFSKKYSVITANIVADVLMAMASQLLSALENGGDLLLSGIICERAEEVLNFYKNLGAKLESEKSRDGWTMLHIKM